MKVAMITRVKSISNPMDAQYFYEWVNNFLKEKNVEKVFVVCDKVSSDSLQNNDLRIEFFLSDDPISPVSMNMVIETIRKDNFDAFIIASKEIEINKQRIKKLINYIENDKDLLVVGYSFKIRDTQLDQELQSYYRNKELVAFQVPWNTCAIWNYKLFIQHVGEFDPITDKNNFSPLKVSVGENIIEADHRGMEDGLAIAKALSKISSSIKFKLIKKGSLYWRVNNTDKHRQKLARKNKVMSNFMEHRGYSINSLTKSRR